MFEWVMVVQWCRSVCVVMYDGCFVGVVEDVGFDMGRRVVLGGW